MSLSGPTLLRVWGLLFITTAVVTLPGCGKKKGRLPVFPARGQLLVDGKAAEGVFVYFWPEAPTTKDAYNPTGQTDAQGNFTLSTYGQGDGAPAGNYIVTVEWPERLNTMSNQWEGDKLNERYKDKTASQLRATIEQKPNDLAPIKINR